MPQTFQGAPTKPTTIAQVADNKGLFSFPPPKAKQADQGQSSKSEVSGPDRTTELENNAVEPTLVSLDPHGTFQANTGSRLKKKPVRHHMSEHRQNEAADAQTAAQAPEVSAIDKLGLAEEVASLTALVRQMQADQERLEQELLKRDEQLAGRDQQIGAVTADLASLKEELTLLRSQVTDAAKMPGYVPSAEPSTVLSAPAAVDSPVSGSDLPTVKSEEGSSLSEQSAPPAAIEPTAETPVEAMPAQPAPPAESEAEALPAAVSAAPTSPSPTSVEPGQTGEPTVEAGQPELVVSEELHRALYEFSKLYNRVEVQHRQAGGTLHPIEETLAKYQYQPRNLVQVLYRNYARTNDPDQAKQKVEDDVRQMIAAITSLMPEAQVKEVQKEVAEKFKASAPDGGKRRGFLGKLKKG